MIKIDDMVIMPKQVVGISKNEYKMNDDITNYVIDIHSTANLMCKTYNNKYERDTAFNKLCEKLESYEDTEKGYVQGFKDGVEYSLKLKGEK